LRVSTRAMIGRQRAHRYDPASDCPPQVRQVALAAQ
jgi:hypothetical protein